MNNIRINIAAIIMAVVARFIGGKEFNEALKEVLNLGREAKAKNSLAPAPTLNEKWMQD